MTNRLKDLSFSMGDRLFGLSAILCGYLYWALPGGHGKGLGGALLVIIMVAFGLIYTHSHGYKQNKRSLLPLGIILLCGANLFIFDSVLERHLAFLFAQMAYIYWIAVTVGNLVDRRLSLYTLAEMGRKFFVVPFANFGACHFSVFYGGREKRNGKNILMALVGLVVAIPILLAVTRLLISADAAFAQMMVMLPMNISHHVVNMIIQFVFGIPVAFYLYGLLFGEARSRYAVSQKESLDLAATQVAIIPGATVYAIMVSLCGIYLAFMGVQAGTLFGGFGGYLPTGYTYAEFARGGFFQLCLVTVINGMVCGFSYIFVRDRRAKAFRFLMAMMAIFTMLLCITAMSKMALYISSYGLTQLRVYTFWFMALVLIIFALVLIRQIATFNGTRAGVLAFVLCFMVLIYGNVDGQIAKYNVERYKAGTLKEVDRGAMLHLSAGASPYLLELYHWEKDEKFKSEIKFMLNRFDPPSQTKKWNDFNLQAYWAGKSFVATFKGI
ncbi:MAG: DUF4153 domain-containing protein [Anaerovoracaceae bacterium]